MKQFNKFFLLPFLIINSFNSVYSQKTIEMKKINGIYQIPCKVNGILMNFVFDTGATDVTISLTEAKFLLKQGLLKKEDFIENVNYQMANGEIIEGTKINLKTIEIGGTILKNISASVIHKQNAPLLLGQSALSKLGQYSINGNQLIINSSVKLDNIDIKTNSTNKNEAINYLNQFLSVKSWGHEIDANFVYNNYSNSLSFKSIASFKDSKNSIIEISYQFRMEDVLNIEEFIHISDKNKSNDRNIIFFDINLKNDIIETNYTKSDGDVIPNYKNSNTNKVTFGIAKSLTEQDLRILSMAIRDIFENVEIITKNL
ncbi:retropepsin-like aspartic protease family protein [Flavobacterium psychrophilum]|uniref:retropepsin-like aspartic protease family protein n=1 Tax=Flavobacterium psychrophilum TaxID=96345 RepID=UPI001D09736F|nr:retropepsin-like aspartic protease [Flavobacterium psychrophilum]MCB6062637.1 retroviral-like aspartic protease family protein [Flavobacterium psychrophilum]